MINNFCDLVEYLKKDSDDFDDDNFKDIFLFKESKLTPERLKILELAIGVIPPVYKDFLLKYDFEKVSVGYFDLCPISYEIIDIVDALIEANTTYPFLPIELLQEEGVYWIGTNNDHTLYVAHKGSTKYAEDEIILIDEEILHGEPREEDIQRLAKDFEQFLIIAGNLNQIHREIKEDRSKYDEKVAEFFNRLDILGVDKVYHNAWLSVF